MKIKSFVTNSSSTSFIMVFDGETKEDLYRILRKYPMFFDLTYDLEFESGQDDAYIVDVEQVIKAIDSVFGKDKNYCEPVVIRNIDILVEDREEEIRRQKKYMEEKKDFSSSLYEWIEENVERLKELKRAKLRGLKSVLEIQFGDNDGHISGTGLGETMDYMGRHIDLSTPDIKIITEQRR